jgi:AraC-like DNA-binding protein
VDVPPVSSTQLHFLREGELWLEIDGGPRQVFRAGSVCFLPTRTAYRVGAGVGGHVIELAHALRHVGPAYARRLGDGEPRGVIICIECDLGPRAVDPFDGTLPSFTLAPPLSAITVSLLEMLDRTLAGKKSGSDLVVTRIAEAIFLSALKTRLESPTQGGTGWVAGFADPQLGRALGTMMRAPEQLHSVETLARDAHMSRSSFATHFTQVAGLSPMAWLTRWRVHVGARAMLAGATVERAAAETGFASSSAFSRAFRKELGAPPARWVRSQLSA